MSYIDDKGPIYFDETTANVKARMEYFYMNNITQNQNYWAEASLDTRAYAGDGLLYQELYASVPMNRQQQYNFNRIRRVVSMIEGYQRRNRKQTQVIPVESGDEVTAEQFTKLLIYLNSRENNLETISTAFHNALITGMSLLQVYQDFTNDPISGDLKLSACAYNEFLIDPFFKKPDLSDCTGIWKRSYVNKQTLKTLLPDREDDIPNSNFRNQDGKFNFTPESFAFQQKNLYTYDEFYYKDSRKQKMLVDTETGETLEWKTDNKDRLEEFLRTYPTVTVVEQNIPTVRMAIAVNDKIVYDGPNGICEMFPFCPVMAYYSPELPYYPLRMQGVVRGLRDAQFLYSRRRTLELGMLESQLNSGWKFKENALVDPKDVFQTGQGGGIALKTEAAMTDVEQIPPPQIAPSWFQLSEALANEVNQISGVNEELLGSATDDKAGILSQLRQGAGLTTLQPLFDALDQSQKLLGKIQIEAIQNNYTTGKIKRIINEEPSQEFYNKNFSKLDCTVEDGVLTSTQRQMAFLQMLELKKIGVNIPDEVLMENMTLQNKKQVIDAVKAANQAKMQGEQQAAQVQAQLQQSQAKAAESMAAERFTRADANEGLNVERRVQAIADLEKAKLDRIRALSELEDMDISKIERLLAMAQQLEMQPGSVTSEVAAAEKAKPQQSPLNNVGAQ